MLAGVCHAMRARWLACMVVALAVVAVAAYAGFAEDAFAKQLQIVTSRGNVLYGKGGHTNQRHQHCPNHQQHAGD